MDILLFIFFFITAIMIGYFFHTVKDPMLGFVISVIIVLPVAMILFTLVFQLIPLAVTGLGFTVIAKMFKGS